MYRPIFCLNGFTDISIISAKVQDFSYAGKQIITRYLIRTFELRRISKWVAEKIFQGKP